MLGRQHLDISVFEKVRIILICCSTRKYYVLLRPHFLVELALFIFFSPGLVFGTMFVNAAYREK